METTDQQAIDEPSEDPGPEAPPPPRGRRWVAVARLVMLPIVVGLIALFLWRKPETFDDLSNLSAGTIAAALGLDILIYIYSAAAIILTVHLFGPRLGAVEAMLVALTTRFGNLVLPLRGGAVARAVYLKKRHGLSYTHFLAGLSAMLLAMLASALAMALIGLVTIGVMTGTHFWPLTVALSAVLGLIALTVIVRPRFASPGDEASAAGKAKGNIGRRALLLSGVRLVGRQVQRLVEGYHLVGRHKPSLAGLLTVSTLHVLTQATIYAVLLAGMGKPASFGLLVIVAAVTHVANVVQITPGNVGIYEALSGFLAAMMGLQAADIVLTVGIWRALDIALILVVGPISGHLLTGKALGSSRKEEDS